jgi:hypothetical protein
MTIIHASVHAKAAPRLPWLQATLKLRLLSSTFGRKKIPAVAELIFPVFD